MKKFEIVQKVRALKPSMSNFDLFFDCNGISPFRWQVYRAVKDGLYPATSDSVPIFIVSLINNS